MGGQPKWPGYSASPTGGSGGSRSWARQATPPLPGGWPHPCPTLPSSWRGTPSTPSSGWPRSSPPGGTGGKGASDGERGAGGHRAVAVGGQAGGRGPGGGGGGR